MIPSSRTRELAQVVRLQAALREGLSREQRLQLGAATLLAFVQQVHGEEARDVLEIASMLSGNHSRAVAETALQALEEIGGLIDADSDATGIALYNPHSTVSAIRLVLEVTSNTMRPTWPPYEEREQVTEGVEP